MSTYTETTDYDQIEVVGPYKSVQVRKVNIVKKDGVEIAREHERYVLNPDNPLTKEPDGVTDIPEEVKSVCNIFWTDEIKTGFAAIAVSSPEES